MPDLLSSGALLATVLSLFYTLWYPEIRHALDTLKPKAQVVDSKGDIVTIERIVRHRVLPLLIASLAMGIALIPDALRVITRSIRALQSPNWAYDAVSTLYVLMVAMVIALVVHVVALDADCRELTKKLKHERT